MTWLLIIHLHGGISVTPLPDYVTCIRRSQFEIRFDAKRVAQCVPWEGGWA